MGVSGKYSSFVSNGISALIGKLSSIGAVSPYGFVRTIILPSWTYARSKSVFATLSAAMRTFAEYSLSRLRCTRLRQLRGGSVYNRLWQCRGLCAFLPLTTSTWHSPEPCSAVSACAILYTVPAAWLAKRYVHFQLKLFCSAQSQTAYLRLPN